MQTGKKSQAPTQNELITVMQYNGAKIAFEEINGKMMINATQMAKPFGRSKRPKNWLRTQQAKELQNVVAVAHKCATTDLQVVRQGGINQGTYFHEDVALFFAQWLSPEFYLACNQKLKELLTNQIIDLSPVYGIKPIAYDGVAMFPYMESVKKLGNVTTSASDRKKLHPEHFKLVFGRNFITRHYLELLRGYYNWKNAQLKLQLQ